MRDDPIAGRVSGLLSLAASPAFAIMALVTGAGGISGSAEWICSAVHEASPLGGMAFMYGLMSVVHSAPWLRLIAGRQVRANRP